ncbi:DUF389 domain-containing protein [Rubrivirga marina]|uniref:TIGR00341 family protein n=1 Tax=Rubrivirga marina TaxID=1196024 RepID=A0A271IYF1_9BACT|nr:DUF389 domain-containing protein [Rubrivirga marina]PAP76281.1 hypothetical protein BSZ37_07390 [Rubrivirga marina]
MPDPDAPPPDGAPEAGAPDGDTEDPVLKHAPEDNGDSAVEEAARRQFGLRTWDRPALYRETAEAGTDTDLPFWLVLFLSGAIATLGLVLNSTAVVIGAMLVAPLLGPLLGLSLALTVGDGRLFVQTGAAVLLGALGIVALAAGLTLLLPFQTVTDEIAARTRPTTLDLGIAVFSGLAGAVVTASREARLSASIPGVAVAVALVPPLGAAGFGVATAQWSITRGALLLFGANLAGIVLSGMAVFFLIGMHRAPVVEAARQWHRSGTATGLAARLSGARWLDRLPGLARPQTRALIVVAFMAAVSVPLTTSLMQIVREARVAAAVDAVEADLRAEDRAFVLDREVQHGEATSAVRLRVATTSWITEDEEAALAARATGLAGEAVTLDLEQVLASSGDLAAFAAALPSPPSSRSGAATPPELPTALAVVRGRLSDALQSLALPDGVQIVGGRIVVEADRSGPVLEVAYAAPRPLPPEAEVTVARQAARALGVDGAQARTRAVVLGPRALPDSAAARPLASLLAAYPRLGLALEGDTTSVRAARQRLVGAGAPASRVTVAPDSTPPRARLTLAPDTVRTQTGG